jgi:hypothetical protein
MLLSPFLPPRPSTIIFGSRFVLSIAMARYLKLYIYVCVVAKILLGFGGRGGIIWVESSYSKQNKTLILDEII